MLFVLLIVCVIYSVGKDNGYREAIEKLSSGEVKFEIWTKTENMRRREIYNETTEVPITKVRSANGGMGEGSNTIG